MPRRTDERHTRYEAEQATALALDERRLAEFEPADRTGDAFAHLKHELIVLADGAVGEPVVVPGSAPSRFGLYEINTGDADGVRGAAIHGCGIQSSIGEGCRDAVLVRPPTSTPNAAP